MYTEITYKYYTLNRLKWKRDVLNEVEQNEDKALTDTDYISFKANIKKIPGCCLKDIEFEFCNNCSTGCKNTNFMNQYQSK